MIKPLPAGTVVDGRYVVESELGAGGMAVVYRVRHRSLGTPAALKLLTVSHPTLRDRLLQEGKVQAALRHPNVVSVSDQIEVAGAVGLVMELVRGPSLAGLIAQMRLSWDQIDDIARGLMDGIEAAHLVGLVHRDLKPANVLIEIAPGRLIPKIADFGLVKILDQQEARGHTRTGTTFGTPEYMAPEQISDAKSVDPRADLFSIGAILFELVTHDKAFDDEDLLELFNKVASGRRRAVRDLAPEAPERMVRAIDAALVPDRDLRVRDVAALRALWTEGAPFPPAAPWSDAAIEQIRAMSQARDTQQVLQESLNVRATAVPPSFTSEPGSEVAPVVPAEPAHEGGGLLGAGALVLIAMLLVGSLGLVGVGMAGLVMVGASLSGSEDPVVADVRPAPTPTPDPAPIAPPAPEPVEPVEGGGPAPEVVVDPAPPTVQPARPVPTAVQPVVPAPVEPPPPQPEVAVTTPAVAPAPTPAPPPPQVRVVGGVQVSFRPLSGDRAGQPLTAAELTGGPVEVVAYFQPLTPKAVQTVEMAAGSRWVVTCEPTSERCKVREEGP
ncbi:MAG: serine/threonine protein kinase [Alphaproteobacteria bacterium]|nr:serine/threonine protein kinase [Alphaproteobacteria bacterium]